MLPMWGIAMTKLTTIFQIAGLPPGMGQMIAKVAGDPDTDAPLPKSRTEALLLLFGEAINKRVPAHSTKDTSPLASDPAMDGPQPMSLAEVLVMLEERHAADQ
jgi:hypothetical protein